MSKQDKRIRIFAGPNGSGKSTLFEEFKKNYSTGYFINADEIQKQLTEKKLIDLSSIGIRPGIKEYQKFYANSTLIDKAKKDGYKINLILKDNFLLRTSVKTHSYEAAFAAAFIRSQLLKNGLSFSFETVMSHDSKIKEIEEANALGYKTYLYFICTDNPSINQYRISSRVKKGGHNVSDDKIKSRYFSSLNLLPLAICNVYRAYLFDNSGKQQSLILETYKGNHLTYYQTNFPLWISNYIQNK